MDWMKALLWGDNAAQAVVALSLAISFGFAIGSIRIRNIGLGVGGVLFSALLLGHLGMAPQNHAVVEFAREFGLILFVFTVGLQVGPGFVDSLRRRGLILNLMAAFIVLMGVVTTVGCYLFFDLPAPVAVGLFSGAVTNTPSLAAASQAFAEMAATPQAAQEATNLAGLGYAVAYPFGIMGIILTMVLLRIFGRVNVCVETQEMECILQSQHPPLQSVTLRVQNACLHGKCIADVCALLPDTFIISRMEDENGPVIARPDKIILPGMLLHIVCHEAALPKVTALIGPAAEVDLRNIESQMHTRSLVVTHAKALGKSVQQIGLVPQNGLTVTRVVRAGMEFSATPQVHLHFGDKVIMVGEVNALDWAERILGNSTKERDHPHIMYLFCGLLLGVVVGSIPLAIPGLPAPLKLGLAGGSLLVAIVLSRVSTVAGMHWYMPHSANLMLREVGIALFLACVGLNAGAGFFKALMDGSGLYWMSIAVLITLIPLICAAVLGRLFLGCNYASTCGLLAGSMTDPPALAFATHSLGSDAPASVYATVYPTTMILRILAGQILVVIMYALGG